MLKIAIPSQSPRGGLWKYRQEESGLIISAYTITEVKSLVKKHRAANNYPIGVNFNAEIEHGICMMLDEDQRGFFCRQAVEVNSPEEIKTRVIMQGDIKGFGQMVAKWVSEGCEFVSQEEAERRANICSDCPYNKKTSDCQTCRNVVRAAVGIAGKSTSRDANLYSCAACLCELRGAVHLPKAIQLEYLSQEVKDSFPAPYCWKSPNSVP